MEEPTHKVKIELGAKPGGGGGALVEVDGMDLTTAIKQVYLSASVDNPTRIVLTLVPAPTRIQVSAKVEVQKFLGELLTSRETQILELIRDVKPDNSNLQSTFDCIEHILTPLVDRD